ncbi:MAG: hypothetical protein QMD04_01610 [Anaerolineales bacterium]|nr:hypothetical protein [Anaerolineales bacterium]
MPSRTGVPPLFAARTVSKPSHPAALPKGLLPGRLSRRVELVETLSKPGRLTVTLGLSLSKSGLDSLRGQQADDDFQDTPTLC